MDPQERNMLTEYGSCCPNCKQYEGFIFEFGAFPTDDPANCVFVDDGKVNLTPKTSVECPKCQHIATWDDFVRAGEILETEREKVV